MTLPRSHSLDASSQGLNQGLSDPPTLALSTCPRSQPQRAGWNHTGTLQARLSHHKCLSLAIFAPHHPGRARRLWSCYLGLLPQSPGWPHPPGQSEGVSQPPTDGSWRYLGVPIPGSAALRDTGTAKPHSGRGRSSRRTGCQRPDRISPVSGENFLPSPTPTHGSSG